ncbi:uncharacterized protein Z518_08772 [Rhinocladiella mackenziei CBS 650.93]|uniref:Zn(2)-C6 fungal-type domain-containing protein n=1 Tax=Rhinocladiella mackenziei CBS 650.93 TaxID=1442369 RepID=A0A0D2IAE1_9EURO|nr:uncharacterized protein Z518_08772 [Rhinocladiella mackenziei CBS 650.93]KIX02829.1 hypothetical protein Z518_08772 [Rhinocladiella mackenziei CBS 650.93]
MVYYGPSAGCKACRTRRVKVFASQVPASSLLDLALRAILIAWQCDQTKPHCNNCTRRRQVCPGYADVFDGAHRNQNKVVIRRFEKENAAKEARSTSSSPSSEPSSDVTSTTSKSSAPTSTMNPNVPLQWIIYSAPREEPGSENSDSRPTEEASSTVATDVPFNNSMSMIPGTVKQDPQEASICFFFRHYTGTIYDQQTHNGFTNMWQPLYLRSSAFSPLRTATAAVAVNVSMMWCFRGCDTRPARSLFTKAIAATREAINNPSQSDMDELLMTILVFDLYDSLVLHYVPDASPYGKHKEGALALVKHRGISNYATDMSRALANSTRHALLDYSLSTRVPIPSGVEKYFDHPSLTFSKATHLDMLSISITNAQTRLWNLRRESPLLKSFSERRKEYEEIIAEAMRLDELIMTWKRGITDQYWIPQYVDREEVAPTIREAGFYGNRCPVWVDLSFSESWNIYYKRRIFILQMIRQAFADMPCLLNDAKSQSVLAKANSTLQLLVDSLCESVPFYIGDIMSPTNPMYSHGINFPYKIITNSQTGVTTSIPDSKSSYRIRAAASGGWMIFPYLVTIWRLAEPEDDAVPFVLREGQLDWVKGQVKRLQTIFLFCDPVW